MAGLPTKPGVTGTGSANQDAAGAQVQTQVKNEDGSLSDQTETVNANLSDSMKEIPLEDDEEAIEDSTNSAEPVAYYRHKRISRFVVGEHEFKNHVYAPTSDKANEDFLNLWAGLLPIDKNNIVRYNPVAAAAVESPIGNTAVRGTMGTSDIKDPKLIK